MLLYRLLRSVLRLVVAVFFRQVEVVGAEHVPDHGPVIFASNHPNSLIDPVLILTSCGRRVHFAAQDMLFRSRLLRPILLALGAVPVRRRCDHGGERVDNRSAFEALEQTLAAGGCMGIFPEGLSHDGPELARLRTGTARIALQAGASVSGGPPLRVVPCGLTYVRPRRFRSLALVQFGEPIEVNAELLQRAASDERATVAKLTERMGESIRALTINAPDWDTLRVLDQVRRLYQPERIGLEQRVELARRFTSVYPFVAAKPDVRALYARVAGFVRRLGDLGLADRDLRRELGPWAALRKVLGHLQLLLIWLPCALPGLLLHAPLGLLAGWAGARLAPRKDATATSKLVVGLAGITLVYGLVPGAAGLWLGWRGALAAALLLPLSGYASLKVLERAEALGRIGGWAWRLVRLRHEARGLREERARLEAAVCEIVKRHLPADMEPLFPEQLAGVAGVSGAPDSGRPPLASGAALPPGAG